LDFRQLRYALSVSKERSFTKAAKRLNISQSAVSEQVKLLEEEIGFELFRRTSGGIESTDRGRTFLYESERVMGDLLSLSDTARRLRGALSDTLMIGMGSGMAQIFIPRIFMQALQFHGSEMWPLALINSMKVSMTACSPFFLIFSMHQC